jgi:hypothetical protein
LVTPDALLISSSGSGRRPARRVASLPVEIDQSGHVDVEAGVHLAQHALAERAKLRPEFGHHLTGGMLTTNQRPRAHIAEGLLIADCADGDEDVIGARLSVILVDLLGGLDLAGIDLMVALKPWPRRASRRRGRRR